MDAVGEFDGMVTSTLSGQVIVGASVSVGKESTGVYKEEISNVCTTCVDSKNGEVRQAVPTFIPSNS